MQICAGRYSNKRPSHYVHFALLEDLDRTVSKSLTPVRDYVEFKYISRCLFFLVFLVITLHAFRFEMHSFRTLVELIV